MKKGDLKRGQILDTAEKLFFECGYDHTSIQDILNAMNMSKGGFYHYFDAKETVLREICERRWDARFDRLRSELYGTRRGVVDRLNLLLGVANLFEAEDIPFAAMMLKLCHRDRDAAIRDLRRRTLVERLTPFVDEVIVEGVKDGSLHTRHPSGTGLMLTLLACDVNDEACDILANDLESPDRLIRVLEMLDVYREGVEALCGAPYGSVTLFDAGRMVTDWQQALEELNRLEEKAL